MSETAETSIWLVCVTCFRFIQVSNIFQQNYQIIWAPAHIFWSIFWALPAQDMNSMATSTCSFESKDLQHPHVWDTAKAVGPSDWMSQEGD